MPEEKKVDESWKEKAKAEPGGAASPSPEPPPPADFNALVLSLATGAFMALGLESEEEGQAKAPDLPRARYSIDLLEMLATKTKGNLAPDEDRRLAALLHQLRMAYVEAVRAPRKSL